MRDNYIICHYNDPTRFTMLGECESVFFSDASENNYRFYSIYLEISTGNIVMLLFQAETPPFVEGVFYSLSGRSFAGWKLTKEGKEYFGYN